MSTGEERTQRWLDSLRDGSEADKIAARRGLARVFEERGMLDEAIELLERNVEAGVRSAETLRWLSRLYQVREVGATGSTNDDQARQDEREPRLVIRPEAIEAHALTLQPWATRDLAPYLVMVVGLGITLGTGLWMLTPLLKP